MKKIIILVLCIALPIIIYLITIDEKIYYLALGDSIAAGQNPYGKIGYGYTDYVADNLESRSKLAFYTKKFAVSGYRTTDLINDINNNKEIIVDDESITLKHALTKADVITLSIGANDLFYKLGINNIDFNYYSVSDLKNYVDGVILDVETLIVLIKKYCKEDIILIGYYNPLWNIKKDYASEIDSIFVYANEKMADMSKKYDLYYVDIYNLFKDNIDYLPNPLDIHPSDSGYKAISEKVIEVINRHVLN
ncbi:MAG: GDSL-type esterase/lipase family protein [Bacilli bacterium]|jgi:lysophospholipase L1-like esterase